MPKLNEVKQQLQDKAAPLAAAKGNKAAAAAQAAAQVEQKIAQIQAAEEARAQRLQAIVQKVVKPILEDAKTVVGLEGVTLRDQMVRMFPPAGVSAQEIAQVTSLRCVVAVFQHPVEPQKPCSVGFCHAPDDTITLYLGRQKVGSTGVGPLVNEGDYVQLRAAVEGLFGDLLMSLVNSGLT